MLFHVSMTILIAASSYLLKPSNARWCEGMIALEAGTNIHAVCSAATAQFNKALGWVLLLCFFEINLTYSERGQSKMVLSDHTLHQKYTPGYGRWYRVALQLSTDNHCSRPQLVSHHPFTSRSCHQSSAVCWLYGGFS